METVKLERVGVEKCVAKERRWQRRKKIGVEAMGVKMDLRVETREGRAERIRCGADSKRKVDERQQPSAQAQFPNKIMQ